MKLPNTLVQRAIIWLLENNYLTETTSDSFSKFIINDENKQIEDIKPKDELKEAEKPQQSQLKPTVIHRGGKTITRFEIPD